MRTRSSSQSSKSGALYGPAATILPWDNSGRYALAFNGSVPGPNRKNDLDETTNLHTHGLHVSPEVNSDNIYLMIEPGESRIYEYRIPTDHPSGTFWYHPHHHSEVASQVFGGLAGAIVIEDSIDDIAEMRSTTERILVLSDPRIGTTKAVLDATTAAK
jgi:FtsP/CotA-like multicopper oxidase with cupredoxin domain